MNSPFKPRHNPLFQHRHFVAIAKMINGFTEDPILKNALAQYFAMELRQHNGNFESGRFLDAAKGTPQTGRDK